MRIWFFLVCLSVVITSCSDATPTAVVVVTATLPPICDEWQASTQNLVCVPTENGQVAQSQDEQVTLRAYDLSIVLTGTVLITLERAVNVQVLEGTAIVSVQGQNRVLSIGQQVSVILDNGIAGFPSEIMLILQRPSNLQLDRLPRRIDSNAFVIQATPRPTDIPTAVPDECPPPLNWNSTYTISSGDTLAAIANRYDLTVEELAEANCLTNVARIRTGQELVVPDAEENTPSSAAPAIGFRADSYVIASGACTILRWDAFGAQEIYLDDEQVSESSSQDICLDETQSFTMRIIFSEELTESRELTITVED